MRELERVCVHTPKVREAWSRDKRRNLGNPTTKLDVQTAFNTHIDTMRNVIKNPGETLQASAPQLVSNESSEDDTPLPVLSAVGLYILYMLTIIIYIIANMYNIDTHTFTSHYSFTDHLQTGALKSRLYLMGVPDSLIMQYQQWQVLSAVLVYIYMLTMIMDITDKMYNI